ncbi:MAG: iron-containing alcohol dehydrogenase [Thermoflexales bacterium]|nr:iron-containing alcohol dehydrogenase [Thermoflexales bacterium]
MWFFRSPTVVFGEDAVLHIRELRGKRAFVVSDKTLNQNGLLAPVLFQLEHAGMQVKIFDDVEPEPALSTVEAGADLCDDFNPDWIVAVGGGSVMDAAKAIWILYENPDIEVDEINPLDSIVLREKARLICVPTTAGTGSEMTWAVVLTDNRGDTPRKLSTGHPLATPDYAIIDPGMSASMPQELTADTGLDALTQAIEGYLATWRNDFSDGPCLTATKLCFNYLKRAWDDADLSSTEDLEAREAMANAAALSGMGYINAMVGLAHSMAHAAGALLKIPHGRACGLFLPYVIDFYVAPDAPADTQTRFVELMASLGETHPTEVAAAGRLASLVRGLVTEIGAPLTLAAAGIEEDDFNHVLDALVDTAANDSVIFTSPRQPSADELRKLFIRAWQD